MKKFFGILAILMILSSNCFAMIFSQPINTGGSIMFMQAGGGMRITNATYNDGDFYRNNRNMYGKGMARFGNGEDALYVHYNAYNISNDDKVYFGGKDMRNTVPIESFVFGEEIFKITTNESITFYMIHTSYDLPDETWWTLIGRRKDGVWVKYFESAEIEKKYFSSHGNVWEGQSICCDNFRVNGDTIIIEYSRYHKNLGKHGNLIKEGEFRFKWDDSAQWFGVEQVVY